MNSKPHKWSQWEDRREKSPSLRRTRLPSRPGLCRRRRNGLARRTDPIHAARSSCAIPALPTQKEWHPHELVRSSNKQLISPGSTCDAASNLGLTESGMIQQHKQELGPNWHDSQTLSADPPHSINCETQSRQPTVIISARKFPAS